MVNLVNNFFSGYTEAYITKNVKYIENKKQ